MGVGAAEEAPAEAAVEFAARNANAAAASSIATLGDSPESKRVLEGIRTGHWKWPAKKCKMPEQKCKKAEQKM
jgi:hypothetical protein